jgi:NAD(P)H-quinone oxidoreductase subunit 5
MLHDYHRMHSAIGGEISPTGRHLEDLFPERTRLWLYRWALDRGHLDTILDRWFIFPLLQISRLFARLDNVGLSARAGRRAKPSISMRSPAEQGVE